MWEGYEEGTWEDAAKKAKEVPELMKEYKEKVAAEKKETDVVPTTTPGLEKAYEKENDHEDAKSTKDILFDHKLAEELKQKGKVSDSRYWYLWEQANNECALSMK